MLNRLNSMNLSKKAALTAVLLYIGFALPLIYFSTVSLEKNLTELLVDQQVSAVKYAANDLEQKITLRIATLQDEADRIPADQIKDKSAIRNYLKQRIEIYRLFSDGVVVIDKNGYGVADFPVLTERAAGNYRDREYFKEVMYSGRPTIGKPRIGSYSNKPAVAIAVPIKNARGEVAGVLAGYIGLSDNHIFNLANTGLGKTGEFILLSNTYRTVISDSTAGHMLMPLDQTGHRFFLDLSLDATNTTTITNDLHGNRSIVSDFHILSDRWVLLGSLPVAEAFAPIRELKQKIYYFSAAILLLVGLLMWWVMHRQLNIVTRSTHYLHKMAFGDTPLHEVPVSRNDEIGEMLHTFNKLQRQIQDNTQALKTSEQRYRNLFENMSNGFALHEMLFDESGKAIDYRFMEVNPAFERLIGLSKVEVIGKTVKEVMPGLEKYWLENYEKVVRSGEPCTFENYSEPLGRWFKVLAYRSEQGRFAVIFEDVTALKSSLKKLEHLAHHDALTELPKRTLFMHRLQLAIAQAKRRNTFFALGFIDLDRFKPVNDTYGHEVGDHLLIEVANRLKGALRSDDSISRVGGDEFAILLTDLKNQTELEELLGRLIKAIAAPYHVDDHHLEISMSMGVTLYPADDATPDTLMRHADAAVYDAKAAGRNCYKMYRI